MEYRPHHNSGRQPERPRIARLVALSARYRRRYTSESPALSPVSSHARGVATILRTWQYSRLGGMPRARHPFGVALNGCRRDARSTPAWREAALCPHAARGDWQAPSPRGARLERPRHGTTNVKIDVMARESRPAFAALSKPNPTLHGDQPARSRVYQSQCLQPGLRPRRSRYNSISSRVRALNCGVARRSNPAVNHSRGATPRAFC